MCDTDHEAAARLACLNAGIGEVLALPLSAAPVDSERDIFTVSWSVAETSEILTMLRDPDAAPVAIEVYRLSDPVDGYVELAVVTTSDLAERVLGTWRAAGGRKPLGSCLHAGIWDTAYPVPDEAPEPMAEISSTDLPGPL